MVFISGALVGQFALLFFTRYRMGYDGWQAINTFHDMWLNGEIEWNEDDDKPKDDPEEDDRK